MGILIEVEVSSSSNQAFLRVFKRESAVLIMKLRWRVQQSSRWKPIPVPSPSVPDYTEVINHPEPPWTSRINYSPVSDVLGSFGAISHRNVRIKRHFAISPPQSLGPVLNLVESCTSQLRANICEEIGVVILSITMVISGKATRGI